MAMYVIDAKGGLWRIDREGPEDWNNITVERPECPHCGHRETAILPFDLASDNFRPSEEVGRHRPLQLPNEVDWPLTVMRNECRWT
jgi:hypothetical protein